MPRGLREPQLSKHLQHGNFPRLALRLAGLQVHQRPRTGSPGKAFTPRPGGKSKLVHPDRTPGSRCA
ncbi:hypothetical protein FMK67_24485 [Klebsiella michiganensis]|nr:hypothetical protein [Klebsiella michiganensis]